MHPCQCFVNHPKLMCVMVWEYFTGFLAMKIFSSKKFILLSSYFYWICPLFFFQIRVSCHPSQPPTYYVALNSRILELEVGTTTPTLCSAGSQAWGFVYARQVLFQAFFILCMWMFCLHIYLCTMCITGTLEGQKRCQGPVTWTVTIYHVGAGNQT